MDKKQYVLKALELLKDTLPLARWLIFMIKNTEMSEGLLDTLINAFQESMKEVANEKALVQVQKGKEFLEELKKREADANKLDEEDIAHLDAMLSKI